MGEYSYILEQQGKTTAEKLAEFTAAIGWRDELATYRIVQDEYEMRAAAAAEQGISLLEEPPYTAEELAALDAESAAYYSAFADNYVATAAFAGSGSGTAEDPYIIINRAELEAITNDLSAHYLLGNDIDIGTTWTSIGTASAPFLGSIDGDGHNVTYTGDYTSLFGNTNGATISRCALYGISVSVSFSGGEIGECAVFSVTSTTWISGITHLSSGSSIIHDCYVNGVSNPGYNDDIRAGGIVGTTDGDATILDSYVINFELSSHISAPIHYGCSSGGIVGTTGWGTSPRVTVSGCVALDGDLIGTSSKIGRIAGNTQYGTKVFTNNYAGSDITLNGNTVSGGTTSDKNGADVSPSTYHTQAFWETTLGWDFQNVWYWDDTEQLPKLQAIRNIPRFPLNVEIGSPQYTTVSQINCSVGASASVQVTPTTSGTTPVSNSYYTFQSQDGQYWMTGYVDKWINNGGTWTADLIWSSSNTDTLPAQSICWCVWCKEYYQSIIDKISG